MSALPRGKHKDSFAVTAPETELTVHAIVSPGQKEVLYPVDAAQPGTGIEVELWAYIGPHLLDQSDCVAIWGQDAVDEWIDEAIERDST